MIHQHLRLSLIVVFWKSACLLAQSDTARLLPTSEIVAKRLNYYTIGQVQLQSDSLTLSLYHGRSVADYLQAETSLSVKSYGTGVAALSMRGMAANHTAILWNGINLQNPLNGLTDLNILDIGANQGVNIKLGACSALFGSGAIGGVVYLENQKPPKTGLHGQLAHGLGSANRQRQSLGLDYGGRVIDASVRIASQSATNDFLYKNTAMIGQPLRRATHAAYDFLNISGNLFARLGTNDLLKIHFWQSRNKREITPTMTAVGDHAVYRDTANRVSAEWAHFFKKSFVKVRGAYLFDKNAYQSDIVENSQNGIRSYIGEAEWDYNFTPKHLLRVGANRTADHSANNNYKENQRRERLAFFLNDALTTDFVTISGNIRQEWVEGNISPTSFSVGFEKNWAPQAAATKPRGAWSLRGAWSRNFGVPTFNDLYWPNLGNPKLVNEQGWSKEIGVGFKQKNLHTRWEANATLFDIDLHGRIVWLPQNDGQWRPNNIDVVHSSGVETWASYSYSGTDCQYKISADYQYAHATDGDGGVLLFVPQHKGGVRAWLQYRKVYFSWQQTGMSRRYSTTDRSIWAAPFASADASLGYSPTLTPKASTTARSLFSAACGALAARFSRWLCRA